MKEKIKKVSILFLSLIVSIASLSSTPLAASTVHATDIGATIEATEAAIDATYLVWNLVKATLNATGKGDILDNADTREELFNIVNDVIMNASGGNFTQSPQYEITMKQYPELSSMLGTGTIWNPAPTVNDNDDVISWDTWQKNPLGGSLILNPNSKEWEPGPDVRDWKKNPVVLTPEQQKEYGLDTNYWKTGEELMKEIAKKNGWLDKDNGGGGSGGGDSGDSGNNSSKGTKVKIGTGILASVTALVVSLTSGKSGNEKIDSLMGTSETPSYTGVEPSIDNGDGTKTVTVRLNYYFDSGVKIETFATQSIALKDSSSGMPYKAFASMSGGNLTAYFGYLGGDRIYSLPFDSMTYTRYKKDGSIDTSGKYSGGFNASQGYSCNLPVFTSIADIKKYLKTGDDSTAINKESKKLVWADVKSMAGKLPSTFNSLTNLPTGKALSSNVLKDFNKDMTNYRKTVSPDDLTNPDTQTQVATKTMQESVTKNTVDEKEKEDEDTKPIPMPEYPTPDKVDIDGSEATRDWRLVFPFCIPFDMIDLYRVFVAEPQAPHWEIPLKSETFNIDYTFVIDFEQFEVLAEIFRTFQIILFILGLCMITSKVIKW